MTEGGDIDKLGRGYIWQNEIPNCLHQNHIFAVRANQKRLLPDYLVALMTSKYGRSYFQLTAKQTTNLASTNTTTLRALQVPLPSLTEQQAILDIIQLEASGFDSAINQAQRQISLIREYRTRLIADVVTGKLDARAAAAGLAAEVGEEDAWLEGEAAGDDEEAQDEPLAPEPDAD